MSVGRSGAQFFGALSRPLSGEAFPSCRRRHPRFHRRPRRHFRLGCRRRRRRHRRNRRHRRRRRMSERRG